MKYPIGIRSFERIRQDRCIYVNKTREIYWLTCKGKYYFLDRPSRFGKNLLSLPSKPTTRDAKICSEDCIQIL